MLKDIRIALRFLMQQRSFAAAVLCTLAIGIGLNASIFSVLDAVVLRPLPFPDSNQLVAVWQQDLKGKSPFVISPANFLDLRKSGAFTDLCAIEEFANRNVILADGETRENIKAARISPDCFSVLRVFPAQGTAFGSPDADAGSAPVVVLAHDLWVSHLGADPNAIGRMIQLNGKAVRVIGVMPAHFQLPLVSADLYMPIRWTAAEAQERRISAYLVIGRLKPTTTIPAIQARLTSLAQTWAREYPESNAEVGLLIRPLQDEVVKAVRPALFATFGASGCLLLLACLNLANLFGVRVLNRQREMEIRASLGASRYQLLRHVVAESILVTSLGGAVGLVLGRIAVRLFVGLFNDTVYFSLPRRSEIGLNWHVLAYSVFLSAMTAFLVSVVSVQHLTKPKQVSQRLPNRQRNRLRTGLVTVQVSFSLALLIAAGLLVRSYSHLQSQNIGFSTKHLLTVTILLPQIANPSPYPKNDFCHRLLEREVTLPNVRAVAAVRFLPMSGVASMWDISVPGATKLPESAAFHTIVTPAYFRCMQIPLLRGRVFNAGDGVAQPRVTILSLTAARKFFPDNPNPVGRYIKIHDEKNAAWQVVGIVGDVRNLRPDISARPQVYVPFDQSSADVDVLTMVVRSDLGASALASASKRIIAELNGGIAATRTKSMSQVVKDASAQWRISTELFFWFGIGALTLALVGVYSLVSFNIAQRTREIAIRIALGSSYKAVFTLLLRATMVMTGLGLILGLLLMVVIHRSLQSLLYETSPFDPTSTSCVVLAYVVLAMLAAFCAGMKITRIEPATALKYE